MLRGIQASIRALVSNGYRRLAPSPTGPEAASAPGPSTHVETGDARDLAEALAHWTERIEHRPETDRILARIDLAECLGVTLRGLRVFHDSADPRLKEVIGRLLGSPRLLGAVIDAGGSVANEYAKLADDLQLAYLVALGVAVSYDCISSDRGLGLLLGSAGMATTDSKTRSYARHLHLLTSTPERHTSIERHADIFTRMVNLIILEGDQQSSKDCDHDDCEGDMRSFVRERLLVQKGYGPTGSNNFYSAIALGNASEVHECLLRAFAEFDLLPLTGQVLRKGRRGIQLEQRLAAVREFAGPEHRNREEERAEWKLDSLDILLSPRRLEALREQHRDRLAFASEQARRVENALLASGLS
jgi:hypothetical protein